MSQSCSRSLRTREDDASATAENPRENDSKLLLNIEPKGCAPVYSNFLPTRTYFSSSSKTRRTKSTVQNEFEDIQVERRKTRPSSVSTKHRLDPNFVEFVPIKNEFQDRKSLPKSMIDLSLTDEMVNFYPVEQKGRNYLKYCTGWLSNHEKPLSKRACVRKYTSGAGWFCTEVNMALAADSPKLLEYGRYIRELKYSIGMSRMNFTGTVFRGLDMSPTEVEKYESKTMFFIPSFTSTSKRKPFEGKNTLIHVDITPEWSKFCMEIQSEHTDYPEEEEILFSCYNLYKYLRTEKSNGQRILKLQLMDYDQYFDYSQNRIVERKW